MRRSRSRTDRSRGYRKLLAEIVASIIRERLDRQAAADFIRREVQEKVSAEDRARLAEVAETEVMSLHEGNFARYRVRPSEYRAWRETWR